ncbi:hypothetical protein COCNU_14G000370 [Cocos nucifera]|uniref:Uncharacterized protein n=1 Tax=Cocos nucifera TaxID=13894 RepID=A0A8K0NBL0_COCNU|nr:hypothetical protein COCNU_14G000370 [Cocos nucifera]
MKVESEVERDGEPNPKDSDPLLQKKEDSSLCSSNEIKDEEIEAASAACCRICLEHDSEPGVLVFFVLLGFFGLILHCASFNDNDPCMAGCRNCCYGWGILDCFPASVEACFALVVIFVIVFAILGIAYGFLAATMAIQRIWQRHYHILAKRELTKASKPYMMHLVLPCLGYISCSLCLF